MSRFSFGLNLGMKPDNKHRIAQSHTVAPICICTIIMGMTRSNRRRPSKRDRQAQTDRSDRADTDQNQTNGDNVRRETDRNRDDQVDRP